MGRYINLFTDFGFKKIFGSEVNKDLLIDFLNELLKGKEVIKDLSYLKNEHLGNTSTDRKAVFDLYCENPQGEKFIIELQKVEQEFFKDRSIYYSTFAIQEQAKKGEDWKYELKHVYTIGILDFEFKSIETNKVESYVQLMDKDTCEVFYDKLTFIYLEMPKFKKTEEELETHFDKWLYIIRNLHKLDDVPSRIKQKIFEKLFEEAELAKYEPQDRRAYEDSLKYYRDLKGALDTSFKKGEIKGKKEGREEGKEEKALEIAKSLIKMGMDNELIAQATGLSSKKIENLRKE